MRLSLDAPSLNERDRADHRQEALMPTGIAILDQITGGGLPRPSAVVLMGPIGSGKSALVRELAVNSLRQGSDLLYYCIDDPADVVRLGLEDHNLQVPSLEAEGRLVFVDMFSKGAEKLAESLPHMDPEDVLEETMKFQDLLDYGQSLAICTGDEVRHESCQGRNIHGSTHGGRQRTIRECNRELGRWSDRDEEKNRRSIGSRRHTESVEDGPEHRAIQRLLLSTYQSRISILKLSDIVEESTDLSEAVSGFYSIVAIDIGWNAAKSLSAFSDVERIFCSCSL